MAKKHKKIFKQKIKEMLSQMESKEKKPTVGVLPTKPVKAIKTTVSEQPKPKTAEYTPVSTSSIASTSIVKSDLKKITLLFGVMIVVVILAAFLSYKTNWLFILADKIYNWAQLGS